MSAVSGREKDIVMEQRRYENIDKIYVDVDLRHEKSSKKIPHTIYYEKKNGEIISIVVTKVLDQRPAAAQKAGGVGTRYTCLLEGRALPTYLFLEKTTDSWFVERKE